MKCEICGRGPAEGVGLYRANEKGVKGIWRCDKHPTPQTFDIMHDPDIRAIDDALGQSKRERIQ